MKGNCKGGREKKKEVVLSGVELDECCVTG